MRLHYYYDHIFMCISFQILEVLGPNSTWTHFQFIHFVAFSPLFLFCLILLTWVVTLISISSLSIFSLILLTNSSKTGTAYGKSPLSASQPLIWHTRTSTPIPRSSSSSSTSERYPNIDKTRFVFFVYCICICRKPLIISARTITSSLFKMKKKKTNCWESKQKFCLKFFFFSLNFPLKIAQIWK